MLFVFGFYASSGELIFEPGDKEVLLAINILDDTIPEEEEFFRVWLKNPKGGAEIGANGYVTIIIPSNDDAHGVVAVAQVIIELYKNVLCIRIASCDVSIFWDIIIPFIGI